MERGFLTTLTLSGASAMYLLNNTILTNNLNLEFTMTV